ncbi:hypothetical protein ACQP2U_42360 (plasmid) [Nocardia sp. CA-084685]|uniref:hypothetical protein n=1 Tax=Nocardia sp. CA-084685 TaxID=3239970 RepID=UPI003D98F919
MTWRVDAAAITTPGSSGGFHLDAPPTFFIEDGPYGAVTVWLYIRYFQALIRVPATAEHHLGITNALTDEDRVLIGHITENGHRTVRPPSHAPHAVARRRTSSRPVGKAIDSSTGGLNRARIALR